MLRFLFFLFLLVVLVSLTSCSKDQSAPTASAGKITAGDLPSPTNLRVEYITDSSASIAWDSVDGATDYDINYKRLPKGKWTNWPHKGTALESVITGLDTYVEYRWAVRAENRSSSSKWAFGENFIVYSSLDDPTPSKSGYNIDLVFQDDLASSVLTNHQKDLIRLAADRWEEVIIGDLEDYDYDIKESMDYRRVIKKHGGEEYIDTLQFDGIIDDIRIYISVFDNVYRSGIAAYAGYHLRRGEWEFREDGTLGDKKGLPTVGIIRYSDSYINLDVTDEMFFSVALHEIGHALAFSHGVFRSLDFLRPLDSEWSNPNTTVFYFTGPLARKYFDLIGGSNFTGNKVPLANIGHWHEVLRSRLKTL